VLCRRGCSAGRASSAIRSSATQPSRMCRRHQSRTRSASLARAAVPREPRLELDREVERPHLLDGEPCVGEEAAPSDSSVSRTWDGSAEALRLLGVVAHAEVVDDGSRAWMPPGELAARLGDVGEVVCRDAGRGELRSLPSANGSSSAKQITSASIPGDGSQLTTWSPLRAALRVDVAASPWRRPIAVRNRRPIRRRGRGPHHYVGGALAG